MEVPVMLTLVKIANNTKDRAFACGHTGATGKAVTISYLEALILYIYPFVQRKITRVESF
jgi:hypothetical protein